MKMNRKIPLFPNKVPFHLSFDSIAAQVIKCKTLEKVEIKFIVLSTKLNVFILQVWEIEKKYNYIEIANKVFHQHVGMK
jgi:hypothetical protein